MIITTIIDGTQQEVEDKTAEALEKATEAIEKLQARVEELEKDNAEMSSCLRAIKKINRQRVAFARKHNYSFFLR